MEASSILSLRKQVLHRSPDNLQSNEEKKSADLSDSFQRVSSVEQFKEHLIDPQKTVKGMALREVPFSCCFYSSRPLSAALTKRRFQIFHFVMGAAQILQLMAGSKENVGYTSRRLRFSSLELRNKSLDSIGCPSISTFMVLKDGIKISPPHQFVCERNALLLEFSEPIQWNGWYFVTSQTGPADYDPVRFQLHSNLLHDGPWHLVSSSTYINIAGSTALMHGAFSTSSIRGQTQTFDLLRERGYAHHIHAAIRGIASTTASLSSAAGATKIGSALIALQEFAAATVHLAEVRTFSCVK
jgi:hypothetical protein